MGFFEKCATASPCARAPVPVTERQLPLALGHQQITEAQQLLRVLEEVECAQRELREALRIAPLAKAFAQFQNDGGVTAADWRDWLAGKHRHGGSRGKRHLHIVVDNEQVQYDGVELAATRQ